VIVTSVETRGSGCTSMVCLAVSGLILVPDSRLKEKLANAFVVLHVSLHPSRFQSSNCVCRYSEIPHDLTTKIWVLIPVVNCH
jgi:hypothetical protein